MIRFSDQFKVSQAVFRGVLIVFEKTLSAEYLGYTRYHFHHKQTVLVKNREKYGRNYTFVSTCSC